MKMKNTSTGTVLAVLVLFTFGPMVIDRAPALEVHGPHSAADLMPEDRKDPDRFRIVKTRLITGGLLPEATVHSTAVLARYGE